MACKGAIQEMRAFSSMQRFILVDGSRSLPRHATGCLLVVLVRPRGLHGDFWQPQSFLIVQFPRLLCEAQYINERLYWMPKKSLRLSRGALALAQIKQRVVKCS